MNKYLKFILKFLGEIVVVTGIWCLLDYLYSKSLNIVSNLIEVSIIILILTLIDLAIKKIKKK